MIMFAGPNVSVAQSALPVVAQVHLSLDQFLPRRTGGVERDRREIGLTEEGRAALPCAQQAIAVIDELAQAAETARGPLRGTVRLKSPDPLAPVSGRFQLMIPARMLE